MVRPGGALADRQHARVIRFGGRVVLPLAREHAEVLQRRTEAVGVLPEHPDLYRERLLIELFRARAVAAHPIILPEVVQHAGVQAALGVVGPLQRRQRATEDRFVLLEFAALASKGRHRHEGADVPSVVPTDGFVDPYSAMNGFMSRASENGATLWKNTEVTGISMGAHGVSGVETARGPVSGGAAQ